MLEAVSCVLEQGVKIFCIVFQYIKGPPVVGYASSDCTCERVPVRSKSNTVPTQHGVKKPPYRRWEVQEGFPCFSS